MTLLRIVAANRTKLYQRSEYRRGGEKVESKGTRVLFFVGKPGECRQYADLLREEFVDADISSDIKLNQNVEYSMILGKDDSAVDAYRQYNPVIIDLSERQNNFNVPCIRVVYSDNPVCQQIGIKNLVEMISTVP